MVFSASVMASEYCFAATLSDGRQVKAQTMHDLAKMLHFWGVRAEAVCCEWQSGHRMMTAGQRVALIATIRALDSGNAIPSDL